MVFAPTRTWAQLPVTEDSYTAQQTPDASVKPAQTADGVFSNQSQVIGKPTLTNKFIYTFRLVASSRRTDGFKYIQRHIEAFRERRHQPRHHAWNVRRIHRGNQSLERNPSGVFDTPTYIPGISYNNAPSLGTTPDGRKRSVHLHSGHGGTDLLPHQCHSTVPTWLSGTPSTVWHWSPLHTPHVGGTSPAINYVIQFDSKSSTTTSHVPGDRRQACNIRVRKAR